MTASPENTAAGAASGRTVLGLFVVTQIVYLVMILITLPHLRELSGGMDPFDMMPGGYDVDYAHRFLAAIGAAGRSFYLTRQIPLDLIYPGLFAISFALIWRWLLAKATNRPGRLAAVMFLPLLAGLADYGENACIIAMAIKFPDLPDLLVAVASTLTIIKSAAVMLYFFALTGLLAVLGRQKFKARG